ncbi:carbohydrate binding domain-containing protein [Paenibacillus eucommiae]|uniref:Membrane protein n=1 Tax=Paenibacillus eucommiae TaxID=1355755 RepID=A0ABS4J5F4_9BACL|nr:carbohydrate binding domain-containing protein [Paenibacillus eucommiae]MBP1994510.1 putative membrane protein [Paenibacillus eucommiae]
MDIRKKSRLAMLLICCLVFQLLAAVMVKPAAAALTGNLIENAGFEDTTGIIPAKWTPFGNIWNNSIKASTEAAYTGNYGVSIQTNTGNSPWVAIAIPIPVEVGATYEVTSWFKSINVTGRPGYKVEFFKGMEKTAENWIMGYTYQSSPDQNNGQWNELEYSIQAPPEATYMYVYLRLWYGSGTVYFDDVSVTKTKNKPQLIVESAQTYYYTDVLNGNVRLLSDPIDEIYSGKTIDVRIINEVSGEELFAQNGIAAAAEVNVPFDTSGMAVEQSYRILAELKDVYGQLIENSEQLIYRWDRPTAIPANGPILVDGKPFFPVIAYHAEQSDYPFLKEIGVNTVQGVIPTNEATMQAILDMTHANGLKMLVPLYYNMRVKENFERTRQFVTRFKDHPAILGYMIMDEPTTNGIPQSELVDAYKLIRSIDSVHPTYMVEAESLHYRQTGQATDILVTDVYPYSQGSPITISAVGDGVRKAISDVDDVKPIWTILQTFRIPGTGWNYLPTIDQLRNMAYQSFLAGTKGFGYYSIHDPGWNLKESELWPGLVNFKEEIALIASLVSGGSKVNENIGSAVQWAIYNKGQEQYVVALNVTQTAQTASIPVTQAGNQVELLYGDQPEQWGSWDSALNVDLGPEQTLVYRITPFVTGVDQAIGEMQSAIGLISNNQWEKKAEKVINELLKVKEELNGTSIDEGKAMSKAEKAMDEITKLRTWVSGKSDLILQGKRDQINALLDQVYARLLPIVQSMARLELQLTAASWLPGDEQDVSILVRNVGDKAIKNARLSIELPYAAGLLPIQKPVGKIKSGESFAVTVNPVIPSTMLPGTYDVKAILSYEYKGKEIHISTKKEVKVTPLLLAQLMPNSLDVAKAGSYPFTIKLTNGSGQPLSVDLSRVAASGITVDLPASLTLAGLESKTVQGLVTVPVSVTKGDFAVSIEALAGGVRHAILPLMVYVDTNPVYNGSFEKQAAAGSQPDGWNMLAGVWDKNVARSGQASARLNPDANNTFNVINTNSIREFPLASGAKYTLTGWVKTSATAGSVALGIRQIEAGGASIGYTWKEVEKTGDWTKVEVTFTTHPNAKRASVYFKMDQAANGAAWLDDLEMNEVTTVLDARLTPESMELNQPGTYPFEVELTNYTSNPVTVDLSREVPNGITVTLESAVTLAASEKKTVQGTIHIPSSVTEDVYSVVIEAKIGNVSYATLPLSVDISTNPVYNGGFEKLTSASKPDGWYTSAGVLDPSVFHSGQYSVKLSADANNANNTINTTPQRAITVIPGRSYRLSGWVKNSTTAGSVALGVRQVNENGGSITYNWTETVKNNEWMKVDVTFTALPQTKTIWAYFKMDQAANGPAWVDDLELIEE